MHDQSAAVMAKNVVINGSKRDQPKNRNRLVTKNETQARGLKSDAPNCAACCIKAWLQNQPTSA